MQLNFAKWLNEADNSGVGVNLNIDWKKFAQNLSGPLNIDMGPQIRGQVDAAVQDAMKKVAVNKPQKTITTPPTPTAKKPGEAFETPQPANKPTPAPVNMAKGVEPEAIPGLNKKGMETLADIIVHRMSGKGKP